MSCLVCNKEIPKFTEHIVCKVFPDADTPDDLPEPQVVGALCSEKCFEEYIREEGWGDKIFHEVSYCPSSDICEEYDNLRGLCNYESKIKNPEESSMTFIPTGLLGGVKWCEAGTAGIIKVNAELHKSNLDLISEIRSFNENSSRLSWIMIGLAVVMAILTILSLPPI